MVFQEQVLAVTAGQGGLDMRALFNPKDGLMLKGGVGDTQSIKEGKEVLGRGLGHDHDLGRQALILKTD
jgi:hypothetical protein